ncbi:MAG: DUF2061 domain-containing protein [Candidatus Hodarchaeota archaeon]
MKWKDKLIENKEIIKESLIKSIIYRVITVLLGMFVALIITGNIFVALSVGIATEIIQFINYFIYETIWTNYHDKRLRKKIEMTREVDIKFDFDLIKEMSFEFSQTDTFIKEYYDSIISFFEKLLENKYLEDIREDILRDKTYFELKHKHKKFSSNIQ